jgi:hypothetical protein
MGLATRHMRLGHTDLSDSAHDGGAAPAPPLPPAAPKPTTRHRRDHCRPPSCTRGASGTSVPQRRRASRCSLKAPTAQASAGNQPHMATHDSSYRTGSRRTTAWSGATPATPPWVALLLRRYAWDTRQHEEPAGGDRISRVRISAVEVASLWGARRSPECSSRARARRRRPRA